MAGGLLDCCALLTGPGYRCVLVYSVHTEDEVGVFGMDSVVAVCCMVVRILRIPYSVT